MSTTSLPPPPVLLVRWCPVCEQTDLAQVLGDPHYRSSVLNAGQRESCDGTIRTLTYVLEATHEPKA